MTSPPSFRSRSTSGRPRRPIRVEPLEPRDLPTTIPFDALAVDPSRYDASTVLVRLKPGPIDVNALGIPGAVAAQPLALVPGLYEVRLAPGKSAAAAVSAAQRNPAVDRVTFNYHVGLTATPNDPQYGSQWGWNNTGQTGGTPDADIDAAEAWNVFTGSAATVVAVLDTGVDYTHPDLAGNIWVNAGEVPGNGVDDDANGFVDDVHGYDFANNDGSPMDDHSHGTHVAGTIGAVGDNNLGVTGVNWDVRIMAVKFLDASGNGTVANAIRALNYAVANGATVSNNSYGGSSAEDADPLFREAIQNAAAFNHIFVAGAGNSSGNNDALGFYPASFPVDNILSVAATDHTDALAYFSNYGNASVHLAAPGVDILSTLPNGQYGTNSGTSMASPHVAGVAALVRGLHPDWTYRRVIDQILNSVDYVPGLDGRVATGGRLNAARALLDLDGPRVVASDPAGGIGGVVSNVRAYFNEPVGLDSFGVDDVASFTGPNGPIAVSAVTPVAGSFNRKFDVTFAPQLARGTYRLVLGPSVSDTAGNPMDQDADGVLGEPTADQYTATFEIGDQYVFHAPGTPTGLAALGTTRSTLVVADDLGIADLDVRINVSAPDVGFLNAALVAPSGARVSLVPMTGTERGPEFRDTVFSDEALAPISGGASPYTGSYRPETPLSVVDGQGTKGTWALEILSLFGGTLHSWSLMVVAQPPRVSVGDVTVTEGDAGTGSATFTVRLSNPIDLPVSVDYATADGTAAAGSDYDAVAGTVTFAPGETVKAVAVPVRGDADDEPDEGFVLNLSNPVNALLPDAQAAATIKNDDRTVSIADTSVVEGNGGFTNATFTLTLSAPSTHPVTVAFATAPGTAAVSADFTTTTGMVTFSPGQTSRTVTVPVRGETRYERNELFLVDITATDALTADAQAVGTIVNDDAVPVMTVNDVSVVEGNSGSRNLVYNVRLTGPSDFPVAFTYAVEPGTATPGTDYTATGGTITIPAGGTGWDVAVPVAGDTDLEASETIRFNLSAVSNAILMDGQSVGTILTDDQSLSIDDVTVTETDAGTFAATFTISLSAAVPFAVAVNYASANGTAGAGNDYAAAVGTVTFAPGETTKTVTVHGFADTRNEPAEHFLLNLSGAVNATLADAQGRATIEDNDPLPAITVSDPVVVEGPNGTRNLAYTLTLSAVSGQTVTVQYATADGTAAAGSDYTAAAGTLVIGAGNRTQTLNVVVAGDTAAETDETVRLFLSSPNNATLADAEAVGTIQDDDSLVVDDVTVTEGDTGTAVARFTVRLLAARDHAVTVNYATGNGTAGAGTDFLGQAGTLTFAPGETEKVVDVVVVGERGHEGDETVFLNLSNAAGAVLADAQGRATISNDDALPNVTIGDVTVVEGPSGTRNATFTLTLSAPTAQGVTVAFTTADGTATGGTDYVPRSGSAGIGAGQLSTTVSVQVNGDTADEGDETVLLNLTGATNAALADAQAVATIVDDDPLPALSVGDTSVTEGHTGTRSLNFSITLSAPSTQPVTVLVTTSDGTGTAGTDYTALTQTVTFSPGQTSRGVSVIVPGDTAAEGSETVFVALSNPTNAVLGDDQGVGTILNDDSTLRVNDVTVTEADDGTATAVFTVTLASGPAADPVTVNYYTSNGTAGGGTDFVNASGTLTFEPGETTRTVDVLVAGDRISEANETFNLNLQLPVNAAVADALGVATVLDAGDPNPTISVTDAAVLEGATGTRNLTFTVRLSAASGRTITVAYATSNGTAAAGSDYQARTGILTFGPNSLSQTVTVPVTGDATGEADETLVLTLSSPTNATLTGAEAVGTIQDDDSLVVDDPVVVEGNDGTAVARFTVRLLAPRAEPVTVDYATGNGTASGGTDFAHTSGTLTFAPGQTAVEVNVPVLGDTGDEADETFHLNLSNAVGTVIADNRGTATITDDDATPTVTVEDAIVAEGNSGTRTVTFTLRLSAPSGQNVAVQYSTADGTATQAGGDYVGRTGTATFGAGQTVLTVGMTVNADTLAESNETFVLNLLGVTNAVLADNQATATIVDDDGTLGTLTAVGGGPTGGSLPAAPPDPAAPPVNGSETQPDRPAPRRTPPARESALRTFAQRHGIFLGTGGLPRPGTEE